MEAPRVDVIIPTRNRIDLTAQAVSSVQSQTFEDWSLYLVDDASDTPELAAMRQLAAADNRITLIERHNQGGPAAARQTGLEAGSAPLVATLDSDDLWHPKKLELQVEAIERWRRTHPQIVACYGLHLWTDYGERKTSQVQKQVGSETILRSPLATSNMSSPLFVRHMLELAGGFLPPKVRPLSTAEGIELFIRLTEFGPLLRVGRILVTCRTHRGARTSSEMSSLKGAQELSWVLQVHAEWLAQWPTEQARLHARAGARYLGAGSYESARQQLRKAWKAAPLKAKVSLIGQYGPFIAKSALLSLARASQ